MEITFENVSKQYKKKYALKDIPTREAKDRVSEPDLSVYPGPGPPRCWPICTASATWNRKGNILPSALLRLDARSRLHSLANLFKIYGEYQSYSYLTDGNGERSISRGRAARFITFMLAAPPHYPRLCLPGNVLFGWLQPTGRRTARWKNTAGNTSGIWNGWTGCFPPNRWSLLYFLCLLNAILPYGMPPNIGACLYVRN